MWVCVCVCASKGPQRNLSAVIWWIKSLCTTIYLRCILFFLYCDECFAQAAEGECGNALALLKKWKCFTVISIEKVEKRKINASYIDLFINLYNKYLQNCWHNTLRYMYVCRITWQIKYVDIVNSAIAAKPMPWVKMIPTCIKIYNFKKKIIENFFKFAA